MTVIKYKEQLNSTENSSIIHLSVFKCGLVHAKLQGPVAQSIAGLTSSLRDQLDKCFTTL